MSGAYTAQPAASSTPSVPPGWPISWPFPGAYPPGYEPDLSMVITSPSSLKFDNAASITGSLRDHETYVTQKPEQGLILWTAKRSTGEIVGLRFSGGSTYFNSRTTAVTLGDTYWGSDAEFEFELTEDDDGETLTLTSASVIFGETVTQTSDIEITIIPIQYSLSVTVTLNAGYSWIPSIGNVEVFAYSFNISPGDTTGDVSSRALYGFLAPTGSAVDFQDSMDEITPLATITGSGVGGDTATLNSSDLDDDQGYYIWTKVAALNGFAAGTSRILITNVTEDIVVYDHTSSLSATGGGVTVEDFHKIRFDTSDGAVTIVDQ